jgi:hypothetical protein
METKTNMNNWMPQGADPFGGFGQASVGVHSIYFQENFDGEVKVIRTKAIAQPELSFVAECEVVASNHESHPVGQVCSFHQKMSVHAAKRAIKEFAIAAMGFDPQNPEHLAQFDQQVPNAPQGVTWTDVVVKQALADEVGAQKQNQMVGRVIHLRTHHKPLKSGPTAKNPRGVITVHAWGPSTGKAGAPARASAPAAPVPVASIQPPAWQQSPAQAPQGAAPWGAPASTQAPQGAAPWQPPPNNGGFNPPWGNGQR